MTTLFPPVLANHGFGLNLNILETNLLNLVLVIVSLVYFLKGFLGGILERRREAILADLKDADERLEAELKAQLLDARKQSLTVIQEAEQEVDGLYREALAMAQAEANSVREQARVQVDAQKAEAFAGIDAQAEQLGSLIVDRLLAA